MKKSSYAAVIARSQSLDGMVRESFWFGDGREFFIAGLKYLNNLIKNTWKTKILESNVFVIHKILAS